MIISIALGFASLAALYLLVNLLAALVRAKKLQFICNAALLALLCAAAFALTGVNATYLGFVSVNPFSAMFALAFTLVAFLANLMVYDQPEGYADFMLLSSFALVGSYLIAFANSLITIMLGMGAIAIPLALIFLLSRKRSAGAATRFLIMSSLSVAAFSFAAVLVYGSSGTLALAAHQQGQVLSLAAALFIASIGFGASVFPFGALLPDVYHGISARAASLLCGLHNSVSLVAFMEVVVLLFLPFASAFQAIAVLSALTMLFGSVLAANQRSLRKMIAYASAAQAGYVLVGIAAQGAGLGAGCVQLFANILSFMGIIGIVAWLEKGERDSMDDLVGLYKENRFAAVALSIFLLSLIGVPFTAGFIGKFLVLLGAVQSGMLWLAVVGAANVAITVFYCARAMTAMYASKSGAKSMRLDLSTTCAISICLLLTLALGVYPQPMITIANNGAAYLLGLVAH